MREPHTHGGTDAPECTTCASQQPASEILRAAAALMRERADLPYVGGASRWETCGTYIQKSSNSPRIGYPSHAEAAIVLHDPDDAKVASEAVAEYIASWHPAVALAVADWLDETARLRDALGSNAADWPAALGVARAYLGGRAAPAVSGSAGATSTT